MDRHINIWLNQQGIENNLKSIRAAINFQVAKIRII